MVPQVLIPFEQRDARLAAFLQHLADSFYADNPSDWIVFRLAGDASSRQYFRVQKGQNASIIVTLYPEPFRVEASAAEALQSRLIHQPDAALSYANDPLAQIEMTAFLEQHSLPVPRLIASNGEAGCIAFQDLGDTRLIEALEGASHAERTRLYSESLSLVAKIQNLTPTLLASADNGKPLVGSVLRFDTDKLMWEMDFFLKHYFGSYLNSPLSPEQAERIDAELRPVCGWLSNRPRYLTHRDYHARNLLMHEGKLYLIDYQDARLGPMTYDLVSILLDPYAPTDDLNHDSLLDAFCEERHIHRNFGFTQEWQAMAIQRLLKACGTYAFQAGVKGNLSFESYLNPTLQRVSRLMEQHGGFDTLRACLRVNV